MDYNDYLESDAGIMLGKPVIKGTRITVALVLKKLSEGATANDLITAYPQLTATAISAVLAYAADVADTETLIAAA